MASSTKSARAVLCLLASPLAALADEPESDLPELEFLEYLGSWASSDAEWQLVDTPMALPEPETRPREDVDPEAGTEDGEESDDQT